MWGEWSKDDLTPCLLWLLFKVGRLDICVNNENTKSKAECSKCSMRGADKRRGDKKGHPVSLQGRWGSVK